MKQQSIFKIITIALGILVGAIFAEIGYRIYHFLNYNDLEDISKEQRQAIHAPNEELALGQIIQLSANPRIIYELIPASTYRFKNVLVSTNERGFRSKTYPKEKDAKTRRIIGLGDSVMFGWGVAQDSVFLKHLERKLNVQDSFNFEIINTAVPGYNTTMEVATLAEKFELEEIDVVLLQFVPNDFDLPDFIRKKPDYFGLKKSFILQEFENYEGNDRRLRTAPFDETNWRFQRNPEKIPPEYRDMVGETAFQKALEQLYKWQQEYGFEIYLLPGTPVEPLPLIVQRLCEKLSIKIIDVKPYWEAYQKLHPDADWKLSKNDPHLSVRAHFVFAEALAEQLLKRK